MLGTNWGFFAFKHCSALTLPWLLVMFRMKQTYLMVQYLMASWLIDSWSKGVCTPCLLSGSLGQVAGEIQSLLPPSLINIWPTLFISN